MKYLFFILFAAAGLLTKAQEIICVNTDPSDANSSIIDFLPPAVPCGPFQNYEVWGSTDPDAAFTLIGTITDAFQPNFVHTNAFTMGDPWYYYIVFNYNCPGNPPIISEVASNALNSYQSQITSMEVTDMGILICWEQSPHVQTDAYVINYLLPNGLAIPYDTIVGISDTCFLDTVSIPEDPDLVITISILDGCGSQSAFDPEGFTLVQFDGVPEQDGCDQLITLSWLPYNNPYPIGFSYNVIATVNGGTPFLAGNLTGTSFNFFDFLDGDTIDFMVQVMDDNMVVRTNSPTIQEIAAIVQPPSELYIYNLTVGPDNRIQTYFFIDVAAELRNITINNGQFDTDITNRIERFDVSEVPGLGNILRIDSVTDPNTSDYFYQVIANDSCNENHSSTIGRTIWLRAKLNDFFKNEVEFNPFELENAVVTNYRLYRDYGAGFQFITSIMPGADDTYEYVDDVSNFFNQRGDFCYKVEADYLFTFPDSSTNNFTSVSNTICIDQRPSVYIPNAIVPEGTNREFKPFIVFGQPDDYRLQIFSRWGEQIFESTNYDVGWFGDKNGELVPTGGYAYVINFTALDGTKIEKKGIVSVIR